MKEYEVKSTLIIESEFMNAAKLRQVETELLDAIIEVVEKHKFFIGGGFQLELVE